MPENPTPICTLPEGYTVVIEDRDYDAGDVLRIPDGSPWISLPCGGDHALFRVEDTDFGLALHDEGQSVLETQYAGGVCGVHYYQRRQISNSGRVAKQELVTGLCFGQASSDSWGVCPGGTLTGCVERSQELLDEESDLPRATRIAAYACEWGSEDACILRWTIDLARGVSEADVLNRATSSCDFDNPVQAGSETCVAAERLLRNIASESLRDAPDSIRGSVARAGCMKLIPGSLRRRSCATSADADSSPRAPFKIHRRDQSAGGPLLRRQGHQRAHGRAQRDRPCVQAPSPRALHNAGAPR